MQPDAEFDLGIPPSARQREATRRWLKGVYARLLETHGAQHWWPAGGRFEILVGAVLTQNTSWTSVERAIARLARACLLAPEAILGVDDALLAECIRPAGYFNVKTRRLKALAAWFVDVGGFAELDQQATPALREALLSVHGVGPETADDILLYAFKRPVFVIDAYTRRIFARLVAAEPGKDYARWQEFFAAHLEADVALFNEYHALLVVHAKAHCRTRPICAGCALADGCRSASFARAQH